MKAIENGTAFESSTGVKNITPHGRVETKD